MAEILQTGQNKTPQQLASDVRTQVLDMLGRDNVKQARQYAKKMTLDFMHVAKEHPSRDMYEALVVIAATAASAVRHGHSSRDEHALRDEVHAAQFLAIAAHACDELNRTVQSDRFTQRASEVIERVHKDIQALHPQAKARVGRFLEQAEKGLVQVNDPGVPVTRLDVQHDLTTMQWRDRNCAFVVPATIATEAGYSMKAPTSEQVMPFRVVSAVYEWAYGHRHRDLLGGKDEAEQEMWEAGDNAEAIICFSSLDEKGRRMAHVAVARNKDGVVEMIDGQTNEWVTMREYFSGEEPFNVKMWTVRAPKKPGLEPSPRRLAKEVIAKLKDPELATENRRELRRLLSRPPEAVRYVVEGEVQQYLADPERADRLWRMADLAAVVTDVEVKARELDRIPTRSETGMRVRHRHATPEDGDIFVTRDPKTDEPRITFPMRKDGYALLDPKTLECVGRVEDRPDLVIQITPVGRTQSISR